LASEAADIGEITQNNRHYSSRSFKVTNVGTNENPYATYYSE